MQRDAQTHEQARVARHEHRSADIYGGPTRSAMHRRAAASKPGARAPVHLQPVSCAARIAQEPQPQPISRT